MSSTKKSTWRDVSYKYCLDLLSTFFVHLSTSAHEPCMLPVTQCIWHWHQIAPYTYQTQLAFIKHQYFWRPDNKKSLSVQSVLSLTPFFFSLFLARSEGASLLDQSTQFPAIPCFTVSSWDIWGNIKARGLPSQIPQACWPGPWLISCKIHALLSQKTLDQGWRGWLIRGNIYLLCQLKLSAGGWGESGGCWHT